MNACWNPGDLRAYVDGELAPEQASRLQAHLESCAECAAAFDEIAGRAARVGALLADLSATAPYRKRQHIGAVRRTWPRAAALAIAACLALLFLSPKPAPPPKAAEIARPFVALDNEPIETGMVVRVALGPNQIQADVIVAPDGRPRAYRLVENPSNHEGVRTE